MSGMSNDGWIPVSEGNPKKDGYYIVTLDGARFGLEEPFTGMTYFKDGKWYGEGSVCAWMQRPKPYKEQVSKIPQEWKDGIMESFERVD